MTAPDHVVEPLKKLLARTGASIHGSSIWDDFCGVFEHEAGEGDNVEASRGLGVALIVFYQPPAPPGAAVLFQG